MDSSSSLLFEMLNGTYWNSVRLKIPTDEVMGWRVELRTMEVQLTADENAALSLLVHLSSQGYYMMTSASICIYPSHCFVKILLVLTVETHSSLKNFTSGSTCEMRASRALKNYRLGRYSLVKGSSRVSLGSLRIVCLAAPKISCT